ncbi:cytochrome C biogenesis protein ResB [Corynebacterium sp. 13CS0277]|uniref:cytochrome c biogenesis protein ResB n=1 Tax=Corynebacterium sp. 13CS0277 TaxID=2071994 RepID=UPI000D03C668|nr:cytochrome c biogenesis protein ResB [Corynebacterium sp. 13CS0277]PRQ10668.1 cytochrome C biogenesis protein ResB [Corynebacterium sp. 13CS0277]
MRTALVLLFLLALGAIPGALLPQRSLNQTKVQEFLDTGGRVAEIYDRLQLFDVFSSQWFTAIYVLLFISLIGCIIPRSVEHYRAYRRPAVAAPKNLARLPHHAAGDVDGDAESLVRDAATQFRGWKTTIVAPEQDRAGGWSLSAEKGYTRELGNLVFHLGIVGILASMGFGKLIAYEGQVIVIADGSQFCNTAVANFDDMRGGALFDGTTLNPFCVQVEDFTADYLPNGQAEQFTSHIAYAEGEGVFAPVEDWSTYTLRVNHPLRLGGDRIYLQGHGFAPTVTVTWPGGEQRTQTIQFRPDDATTFLSSGVLRFDPPAGMYPDPYERRQHQLAIQGLFAPTAHFEGTLLTSAYPALTNPALAVDIYRGDVGLDSGKGQNIFSLDSAQLHSGALQKIDRVNLTAGETVTLDDGTTVTFDGAKEFVNLQISHDPTQIWVLVSAVAMVGGLVTSVLVKRRRIFVRVKDGRMEVGGLSRTDAAGWGEEFQRISAALL